MQDVPLGPAVRYLQKCGTTDCMVLGIDASEKSEEQILSDVSGGGLTGATSKPKFQGVWYGGALSPKDGCLYYVPGHAEQVLKFDPVSGDRQLIGPKLQGSEKFAGAVRGRDGCIYGMPDGHSQVLRIDPQKEVRLIGDPIRTNVMKGAYKGGALAGDGCIYAAPHKATRVLKINTTTQSVSLIGGELDCKNGWAGAVTANDGCVWCIPHHAKQALKIDPIKQQVTLVGESFDGESKWMGGALGDDGCICVLPLHACTSCISCLHMLGRAVHVSMS